jgi:hypothetical protein
LIAKGLIELALAMANDSDRSPSSSDRRYLQASVAQQAIWSLLKS